MSIRRRVARPLRAPGAAIALGATALAAVLGCGVLTARPAPAASSAVYYVALGDSVGAGASASAGSGYVDVIYQHELARTPGLLLQNLSCGGATTSSVVHSISCGASAPQLTLAEQFLQAHPGRIAFVTIDIGGNDVAGCGTDTTCLQNGLAAVNTNLPTILNGLEAADPGVRVFGMNYYDPFLSTWLDGAAGQAAAQQSVTSSDTFNALLTNLYTAGGFPTADVGTAFAIDDFSLTGTYNGQTVPQNVANACTWTNMCASGDFHANTAGHAVIAQTFEPLIDTPRAPGVPTTVGTSPGNGGITVRWNAPAISGGSPITAYVVTPFVGTTAKPARIFPAPATSDFVSGLTNGTVYTFRVAAQNAIGTGAESTASGPIAAGAPLAPTGLSTVPGNGSITVRWTAASANGSPLTGYTVRVYRASVLSNTLAIGVTTQTTVGGLVNGQAYTFTVAARNARGVSHPASTSPRIAGSPTAPAGVTATAGTGRATVRWTAPANNGAAVTAYVVTPYLAGVAQPARTFASTATMQTITALPSARTFTFRVAAKNARGIGPQSTASNAVTIA